MAVPFNPYSPFRRAPGRVVQMPSLGAPGGGPRNTMGGMNFNFTAPQISLPAYNPEPAMGMYRDIFNRATGGTINSFDRAANRLRERLDSASAGQRSEVAGRNLSRGFGASGLNDMDLQKLDDSYLGNYAQGLSELENMFEGQRLQGLGIANQAAAGTAGEQQFGFSGLLQQALANAQNATQAGIAGLNARSGYETARLGNQNSILQYLIKALSAYGA